MKNFIVLSGTLFTFSVLAETFKVSGTPIEISPPQGFARATKQIEKTFSETFAAANPRPTVLSVYIPEVSLQKILRGNDVGYDKFYLLHTFPTVIRGTMSIQGFSEFKQGIKNTTRNTQKELQDRLEQKGVPLDDITAALQAVPVFVLDFHYETDWALSYSMYNVVPGETSGSGVSFRVSTMTVFNVSGKVLALMCIAQADQIEWTREASRTWVEAITKTNPPPPNRRTASGEAAYQRGRKFGYIAGFILGGFIVLCVPLTVIFCIAYVLVKCFKRKHKSSMVLQEGIQEGRKGGFTEK